MERHRLDVLSLIFGLIFTAVAVLGLTDVLTLTFADLRWLGPAVLVVVGVALLFTAGRSRDQGRATDHLDDPVRDAADDAHQEDADQAV